MDGTNLDSALGKFSIYGRYYTTSFLFIIIAVVANRLYTFNFIFIAEKNDYRCKDEGFPNGTCSNPDNSSQVCSEWIYDNPNSFVAEFQLACQEWKRMLVGTAHSFGYMIGLLFVGPLSDRFGRKRLMVITAVLGGVIGLAKSFTTWYWMYVALEFLEPAIGDLSSPLFTLSMEMISNEQRVTYQMMLNFGYSFGSLLLAFLAWLCPNWRVLLRLMYTPALFFFFYTFALDESPRWLLSKGKKERAVAIIQKIAKINKVRLDQNTLDKLTYEESRKMSFIKLIKITFSSRSLLRRFFICLCWWITCTFVYYGMSINFVSLQGNKYLNYALISVIEIPGIIVTLYLMIRFKRKLPLMACFFASAVFCFIQPIVPTNLPWLSVISYMAGKLVSAAYFNITYIFTSELFPTYTRNSMHALCSSLGRIGSIIAPQTPLLMVYWPGLPSLIFGSVSLLAGIVTCFVPDIADTMPDTVRQAEALGDKELQKTNEQVVLMTSERDSNCR